MDGKFDEYMDWLKTMWKPQQEAAIKAGYVLSYEVIRAEPRSADEPDLLLVTRFKNYAALDGTLAKFDAHREAIRRLREGVQRGTVRPV